MKWIKDRQKFLNEAKLRDVIFQRQAKEVSRIWGEKFLDYEEVTPTNKIKQGRWKLSDEDKNQVLGKFFQCDMNEVYNVFSGVPDKFVDILAQSVNVDLLRDEKYKTILKDSLNIKSPTIDQMVIIFDSIFRKLAVSETNATEMIQKDENGRPVKDEAGNMIKITKEKGAPIFTNNLVNINAFLDDYNRCYPEDKVTSSFQNRQLDNLRSMAKEDHNQEYSVDFEVFNRDIYLVISHNPKDILNMSISKFYASCQHLYSGGLRFSSRITGTSEDLLTVATAGYYFEMTTQKYLSFERGITACHHRITKLFRYHAFCLKGSYSKYHFGSKPKIRRYVLCRQPQ